MVRESSFEERVKGSHLPPKTERSLLEFYHSYTESAGGSFDTLFETYLDLIVNEHKRPYTFEHYHRRLREPIDYYAFGVTFLSNLALKERSRVLGKDNLDALLSQLNKGENVVFFANHQIEADPQAISFLLDPLYSNFAEKIIFVAGERVITDPLAIPFSLGRDLLCIYSKRYIDHPASQKAAKQLHNKKTMEVMGELLRQGGQCIYVAPSGGRDRKNERGVIEVAPFDPQNIQMFYLMAEKAATPTHFYPMALATYDLLPPPDKVEIELGEKRRTGKHPIGLAIGEEFSMLTFTGCEVKDKREFRNLRALHLHATVSQLYQNLLGVL